MLNMTRLVLLVALAACTPPVESDLEWHLDESPGCSSDDALVLDAADKWAELGLIVEQGPAGASVCITDGPFWGSRRGVTEWSGGRVRITVRSDTPEAWWTVSYLAHEMGHALLGNGEHVDDSMCGRVGAPDPCTGIMGAKYIAPQFTQLDLDLFLAQGLLPATGHP